MTGHPGQGRPSQGSRCEACCGPEGRVHFWFGRAGRGPADAFLPGDGHRPGRHDRLVPLPDGNARFATACSVSPGRSAKSADRRRHGPAAGVRCGDSDDAATRRPGKVLAARVFEPHAFSRRIKEIHRTGAGYANDFDARRPISSFCGFIFDQDDVCGGSWSARRRSASVAKRCDSLRVMLGRHVLEAVDDLAVKFFRGFPRPGGILDSQTNSTRRSRRPARTSPARSSTGSPSPATSCSPIAPGLGPSRGNRPWSWPTRASTRRPNCSGSTSRRRMGRSVTWLPPCSCAARACPRRGFFAAKGLQKLSVEDFRKDYRILLDKRHAHRAIGAADWRNCCASWMKKN